MSALQPGQRIREPTGMSALQPWQRIREPTGMSALQPGQRIREPTRMSALQPGQRIREPTGMSALQTFGMWASEAAVGPIFPAPAKPGLDWIVKNVIGQTRACL